MADGAYFFNFSRKTLVGVRPSPTKQVGKTHVPTYSRFKVLDLYRFVNNIGNDIVTLLLKVVCFLINMLKTRLKLLF